MKPSDTKPNSLAQGLTTALVLLVVGVLIAGSRLQLSSAAPQERAFENKIPDHIGEAPYFEKGVRENRWPQSTKLTAQIQTPSFGDGTGFFGTEPFPPASSHKRQRVATTKARATPAISTRTDKIK